MLTSSNSKSIDNSINLDSNKKRKMKNSFPPSQLPSTSSLAVANLKSSCTLDEAVEYELKHGKKFDLNLDVKTLRRSISNRLSAQRSRQKRSLHINDMENTVKDLEYMISILTPQVESHKEKRKELLLQNDSLQKLIEIRASEAKIAEIELEQKRLEIRRLKEVAKAFNKTRYDLGSTSKLMHDPRLNHLSSRPYSLEFYQNGLRKIATKQVCQEQLSRSSRLVKSEPESTPTVGLKKAVKIECID